jgi:hypothetical protein
MEKNDYNKMIATNASVIYTGRIASGDTGHVDIESSISDAEEIAKLAGIEEPIDEPVAREDQPYAEKHIIDCDKDPFCPDWLKVENHKRGGQIAFDPEKIELYLTERQKTEWVNSTDVQKELEGRNVLNANVLDYLLAHPELIPESWKKDENGNARFIYFWGTIYRDSGDRLCVRCLYWGVGRWDWDRSWLGAGFVGQVPAAVFAK